jgi:hypothetical protein
MGGPLQRTTDAALMVNDVLGIKGQASKDLTPGMDDEKGCNSSRIQEHYCPNARLCCFN